MPTSIDQKEEVVRLLGRLGIGLLELIASIQDGILVLNRQRRVVVALGEWPDDSSRRSEDFAGKTLREMFGTQAAAVHEAACMRALQGDHIAYEWTRRRGRQPRRLSTTASPLRNSSSDIVGAVLVVRDIPPLGRDERRGRESTAQNTRRLLELEQGIQQLAGAIKNYRKTEETPREFHADSPLNQLSSRERQVLDLLGQGYRPRSIAAELHVSPETVRNHLKAMFRKTGTHSQEELTAMLRAVRFGA
jgi:DNA-binding CsgD family transcriptional regulator